MRRYAFSAAILLVVVPAGAADLYLPDYAYSPIAPAEATSTWTGFYAGISGAFLGGQTTTSAAGTGVMTDVSLNGGTLGVTLGANYQQDGIVVGAEADIAWSTAKGSANCAAAGFTCHSELRWVGTLRGRVGFTYENALLYGTAGLAVAEGHGYSDPAGPGFSGVFTSGFVGWTAGIGAEFKVTRSISVKGEYAYTDFGRQTAPAGTLSSAAQDIWAKTHTAKLGVNYHF